jgi:hypothetical protein
MNRTDTEDSDLQDKDLIKRYLAGEETAFEEFCNKHEGLIRTLIKKKVWEEENVEEIKQEFWYYPTFRHRVGGISGALSHGCSVQSIGRPVHSQ